MNKRMLLMLLGVGLLFGGIFGYKAFVDQMVEGFFDDMEAETVTITASTARLERWTPRVDAVGTFNPVQGAELSLEAAGTTRKFISPIVERIHTLMQVCPPFERAIQAHLTHY